MFIDVDLIVHISWLFISIKERQNKYKAKADGTPIFVRRTYVVYFRETLVSDVYAVFFIRFEGYLNS